MEFRHIPDTDLQCSLVGLGTGTLTSLSSNISQSEARRLIESAADCGINFIDTADVYGQGESERVIGKVLHGRRDKFIVASKAGYHPARFGVLIQRAKPILKTLLRHVNKGRNFAANMRRGLPTRNILRQNFSTSYLEHAIGRSLRRLNTDYLDLFFLHDVPLPALKTGAVFQFLCRLRESGKIRHFGVASSDPAVLEDALKQPGINLAETAIHPGRPPSLWSVLRKLEAAKVGIVANQVFASGQLLKSTGDSIQVRLRIVADRNGLSERQVLLQFATQQPGVFSVLTGTTSVEHLQQNIADLLSAPNLTRQQLEFLSGNLASV